MTIKRLFTILSIALGVPAAVGAAPSNKTLTSPDGKIEVSIETEGKVSYSVTYNGKQILAPSTVSMSLSDGAVFGADKKPSKVKTGSVETRGIPTVAYKKNAVDDIYNFLTLSYKTYSIEFRAYDDAVAYRFVSTAKKGGFNVVGEQAEFNFAEDWKSWTSYVRKKGTFAEQFNNSFENYYKHLKISKWDTSRLAFLPIVVEAEDGVKVCIMESDLFNYPGMYLNGQGGKGLKGVFAPYPDVLKQEGHNNLQLYVKSAKDHIAEAKAGQSFPWRIVSIVPKATDLTNLDLVWNLSTPAADTDWSWVKPGKVAWDWWNDWNIYGVDFEAGVNNDTYKYYIDFASAHGIEYVILDEGWAVNKKADLFQVIPEIDLEELVAYGKGKNVGLILWAGFAAVERDIEKVFKHFSEMGVKGFKIDFMDRDDQLAVEFYENCAKMGAKYKMLVDFHGAYKPTGLYRTYPNVLNFEGVNGMEQLKWGDLPAYDEVTYDCAIPFIRMACGPMDYTQGAMRNATKDNFRAVNTEPMSQGTRCRQLAEYAIFDAPLTMMCDSPSNYMAEPECTEFIAGFPTTWDETVPVCGEIGEYVAIARRKGSDWYVGAITNWDARELTLDLGFIGSGSMTVFQDGPNAHRAAKDYKKLSQTLPSDGKVKVKMAPGGGWAAKISK